MEEVSSHIYEKVTAGGSVEEVFAAFGQSQELAQFYGREAIVKGGGASLLGIELPIAILDFSFWQALYWLTLLVAGLLYVTSRKLWQYLQRFLRNLSLNCPTIKLIFRNSAKMIPKRCRY